MFVITNRRIGKGTGVGQFQKTPNEKGPNELRLFEATKKGKKWNVDLFPDKLTADLKKKAGLPANKPAFASQYVAKEVLRRVRVGKKNLVFFVHGFNNDLESVLERARDFETHYGVEVVAFSWPANGGGARGVLSYKSDKRDARASAGAVYRSLAKARQYLDSFNEVLLADVRSRAEKAHPDNLELRQDYITRMAEKGCPFKVSLVAHSMGNYLLKQIHDSSVYEEHHMLFDNVVLAAADTNTKGHEAWVDSIRCRGRVFVMINEDDSALRASRVQLSSGSTLITRPRAPWFSKRTRPPTLANRVSSLPRPTLWPGKNFVPRWSTRIEPPVTF